MRIRAPVWLTLVAAACALGSAAATASSDVADAVMRHDSARLTQLISQKADVNAPQADGTTALHWAAHQGDIAATTALLRAGANPSAVTGTGMTALALACETGNATL